MRVYGHLQQKNKPTFWWRVVLLKKYFEEYFKRFGTVFVLLSNRG